MMEISSPAFDGWRGANRRGGSGVSRQDRASAHESVAGDEAVADADDAAGVAGDLFLVGDDDERVALVGEGLKELEDFFAGAGVEISSRLVGEEDRRAVDEGAGDGDALALAAGHFVRAMVHAIGETDIAERAERDFTALVRIDAGINEWQLDVPQRAGLGEQIEGLEDEPDLVVADVRELVVVHFAITVEVSDGRIGRARGAGAERHS